MSFQNSKSNLTLVNKTHFFNPVTSRIRNTFPSPESYKYKNDRIKSYQTRLYYEFLNCNKKGGQTFFYTLTYNNKNLPYYHKQVCFDYDHIRSLLTGGFNKYLLRHYGTVLRYFVSGELGDGKGVRGYHNNPHYHILFYLYPTSAFPDKVFSDASVYKSINPVSFRSLVRKYWQGFDQDIDGKRDFRTACKFGIVKEGLYCGLIQDFHGLFYCAKYVCKDVTLKMFESKLESHLRIRYGKYRYTSKSVKDFLSLYPHYLNDLLSSGFFDDVSSIGFDDLLSYMKSDYNIFCDDHIDECVRLGLSDFRNRHSNKVRLSNGIGDYGLDFIDSNSLISIPSKKGFKKVPVSQYYFRKKYTDVVFHPSSDSPLRVLNTDGIEYKVGRLKQSISNFSDHAYNSINFLLSSRIVFDDFRNSSFNKSVSTDFDSFRYSFYSNVNFDEKGQKGITDFCKRYAVYKLVYSDRFYSLLKRGDSFYHPPLSTFSDYRNFIRPKVFTCPFMDSPVSEFVSSGCKGYLPFSSHPSFYRYVGFYSLLDNFSDYLFVQKDNLFEKQAKETEAVRRFHVFRMNSNLFNQF